LGRTIRMRSPQFVQDVKSDPDFLRASYEVSQEICVPLIKEGHLFGTLNIESAAPQKLTEDDVNLLITFAGQVVVAIENARLYSEVQRLAIVDELTGLYNRRGFFEIGKREWERAYRLNRTLAVLFIDVDHFKRFNDAYSYAVGDQVLRLLAGSLRANLRDIDLIGRYGGEEFVVIMPEVDEQTSLIVAERIRHQIEIMETRTEKGSIRVTVSIGVCSKKSEFLTLDQLLDKAGQALHLAKNQGRNCVVLSSSK
jgi:diguanylate cyclase (GGDEF)-like protein